MAVIKNDHQIFTINTERNDNHSMRPKDVMRHKETLETLNRLMDEGVDKIAVIIRHSHRYFGEDSAKEPFLGLTEQGKNHAFELGTWLPLTLQPHFFSSFFGRCIETAFLMDKGYIKAHGVFSDHNILAEALAPFYVRDLAKAIALMTQTGTPAFLRSWFNLEIDDTIMQNPEQTADIITDFLLSRLKTLSPGEMAVCVSHDWNLFPLKEFKLGLSLEAHGTVGFMEGVMVYEKEGSHYMTSYQSDPVLLEKT